jgi:hypothetical protein
LTTNNLGKGKIIQRDININVALITCSNRGKSLKEFIKENPM